jgi:hypothetical protein
MQTRLPPSGSLRAGRQSMLLISRPVRLSAVGSCPGRRDLSRFARSDREMIEGSGLDIDESLIEDGWTEKNFNPGA